MFFFFQAEDGIRDYKVTGVQTCALPISAPRAGVASAVSHGSAGSAPAAEDPGGSGHHGGTEPAGDGRASTQIGRASCRERVETTAGELSRQSTKRRSAETCTRHKAASTL